MKIILSIVFLILAYTGIFAQAFSKVEKRSDLNLNTPSVRSENVGTTEYRTLHSEASSEESFPLPSVVGRWKLHSIDGLTNMSGVPISGTLDLKANHTSESIMFGKKSVGTYQVLKENNEILLVFTNDKGVDEKLIIKQATATNLILLLDGSDMRFVK